MADTGLNGILAFVPARGGSKGMPHKNLAEINGLPLVCHTFELISALGDLVIPFISTDSREILDLAGAHGLPVDYLRPAELATDESPFIEAVWHALDWLSENKNIRPGHVLMLQPTSPLRTYEQVTSAIQRFQNPQVRALVSVHEMCEHPYECVETAETGWSYLRTPSTPVKHRQDYENKFYYIDGSIYLATVEFLKEHGGFAVPGETVLLQTDALYSVDIDEPEDLAVADALMRFRGGRGAK